MCLFFFLNGKFSRYRYIPTPRIRTPWDVEINTTTIPPPGSTVGPLSRSPGLRLAGRTGRCCSCRSATGTKRLAAEVAESWDDKRKKPQGNTLGKWIFFQASLYNHPQMKGISYKNTVWFFGVPGGSVGEILRLEGEETSKFEVWGRLRGAQFFFSGTPKKLGRNMKNC